MTNWMNVNSILTNLMRNSLCTFSRLYYTQRKDAFSINFWTSLTFTSSMRLLTKQRSSILVLFFGCFKSLTNTKMIMIYVCWRLRRSLKLLLIIKLYSTTRRWPLSKSLIKHWTISDKIALPSQITPPLKLLLQNSSKSYL